MLAWRWVPCCGFVPGEGCVQEFGLVSEKMLELLLLPEGVQLSVGRGLPSRNLFLLVPVLPPDSLLYRELRTCPVGVSKAVGPSMCWCGGGGECDVLGNCGGDGKVGGELG